MLGLTIAAPIGPTSLLCIERTLAGGALAGMATGYGAATTHMAYATAAATGLVVLVSAASTPWLIGPFQVGCAAFLLYLARRTLRRRVPFLVSMTGARPTRQTLRAWRSYGVGLVWTLGNPMTLLGFAALSPSLLGDVDRMEHTVPLLAAGVFLGSATWWTTLAAGVALGRNHLTERGLRLANLVTATLLALLALGVLARVAWP